MTNRRFRVVAMGAAAALLISVAACATAQPTPTFVHVTVSPSRAASATATDRLAGTGTPFVAPTHTPASSPTAVVSVAPTPTPTPTLTPSPTPSGSAGGCSGSDKNKAWWTAESPHFTWAVYCGVVPGGWYMTAGNDNYMSGGKLDASYKDPAGGLFTINEGAFCTTSVAACSPHTGASLGAASFGDLSGQLYALSGGGFAIYVGPGTVHGYTAVGESMSQATFVALAAALMKVPKA